MIWDLHPRHRYAGSYLPRSQMPSKTIISTEICDESDEDLPWILTYESTLLKGNEPVVELSVSDFEKMAMYAVGLNSESTTRQRLPFSSPAATAWASFPRETVSSAIELDSHNRVTITRFCVTRDACNRVHRKPPHPIHVRQRKICGRRPTSDHISERLTDQQLYPTLSSSHALQGNASTHARGTKAYRRPF